MLLISLQYLHEHDPQIIHRDISSKNILLDGNRVKISDLGQAKFVDFADRQTVAPGAVVYSAPEVGFRSASAPSLCAVAVLKGAAWCFRVAAGAYRPLHCQD